MRKGLIALAILCIALIGFSTTAFAKNFDISFTLTPNGPSQYSGQGYKVDNDTNCYITTTGGSVVSNELQYKVRGKDKWMTTQGYAYYDATQLGGPYTKKITSKKLSYVDNSYDNYYTEIKNGDYSQFTFVLAASLHSGSSGNYNLTGRWNP
jgi:hypothetical protein